MLQGFGAAIVGAALNDLQMLSKAVDPLVMGTVDTHFDRKILEKTGIFHHNGRVERVSGRRTVQQISRHILEDRSTESHIDDLHALTDADHGNPCSNSSVKSLELQNIQFGINRAGAF